MKLYSQHKSASTYILDVDTMHVVPKRHLEHHVNSMKSMETMMKTMEKNNKNHGAINENHGKSMKNIENVMKTVENQCKLWKS